MERMYAILLHLGDKMWHKPGHRKDQFPYAELHKYSDTLLCDDAVWREITDFLPENGINTLLIDMGEGVELRRHPELAVEGTWSQEKFKAELARLRGLGLTPLPKFNFSCGHNAWMKDMAYRVGTPEYYDFCRDIIEETAELFDRPAFFHLGLEEEDPASQKGQPVIITRSPEKKLADALFLFDICRACGARPWIWVDPNCVESFGGEEAFRTKMPRDVLMSNWYYGIANAYDDPALNPRLLLYKKLDEWGFEQVPTCSTWSSQANDIVTMRVCREWAAPERVLGYMTAPWYMTIPRQIYALKNDVFTFGWSKKQIYPED